MPDKKDKGSKLAKKLVAINHEDRRQMQYMTMKEWDAGLITGVEAIEAIVDLEKIINVDIATLRNAKAGTLGKK